jgi:uncharacterized membrane protein YeaQ/YmgE (transglycosylase-associated protein family)
MVAAEVVDKIGDFDETGQAVVREACYTLGLPPHEFDLQPATPIMAPHRVDRHGAGIGSSERLRGGDGMEISGIITAIVIGAIIGVLGRLVLPGRQHTGVLLTIAVGIVAALVGTAFAAGLGVANTEGIDWIELGIQVALAAVGVGAVERLKTR